MRTRLGLYGFGEHPWRSVDRTRRFYLEALAPRFELVFAEGGLDARAVDAVLSFGGDRAWSEVAGATVPYLFAVHGGATLDHVLLRSYADRLRSSDTLIVNCESDETILSRMFAERKPLFGRLPLPATAAYFRETTPEEAREELPFAEHPDLVIGFVARLLPQKNFHQFLLMFADLSARLAPRRLHAVVVGEYWVDYPVLPYVTGPYRDYVSGLARALGVSDRVVYLGGALCDDDLRLAYASMDVLIHPTCSLDENFGYVPVEAMASGTPVVGAAYGGLKDTIVHGTTGYLMPTWTTASGLRMDLIGGVEHAARLLRHRELRQRLSAAARLHAEAHYRYEPCAARLVDAVRCAIDAHPAAEALAPGAPLVFPKAAGYLPALEVGWEHYWPVVDDYAQGSLPHLSPETLLRLAAPARLEGSRLELADPAWPAIIPVDAEEQRVCTECQGIRRRAELESDDRVLAGLLAKGALIASNEHLETES
jgi:glycosyltransferase involved in cell wall biosynthesis